LLWLQYVSQDIQNLVIIYATRETELVIDKYQGIVQIARWNLLKKMLLTFIDLGIRHVIVIHNHPVAIKALQIDLGQLNGLRRRPSRASTP